MTITIKQAQKIFEASGLSQRAFARKVGISKGAMYYFLNGKNMPNVLRKIESTYNVPADAEDHYYEPEKPTIWGRIMRWFLF